MYSFHTLFDLCIRIAKGECKKMTVTISPKHEIATDDNDNETCCTNTKPSSSNDHTNSLLEDLEEDKDDSSNEEYMNSDNGKEVRQSDVDQEKAKILLNYEDAPEYLKHNRFIRSGYRGILNTDLCVQSIFWWTNETINIWSHIFGLVLFISLTVYDFMILKVQATNGDKVIVASFLLCFMACMALSSLYHTFSCRSEEDCYTFLAYDLFGIALSLLAIYMSGIYYAYWCDTEWQMFYLITVAIIFIFAMILQIPKLNVNPHVKMLVFVAWAGYGVIPTIHWTFRMGGLENPVVTLLLPRVLGMYAISGMAFFIYITKIPERYCSGRFDFIGHSHQWWHFFVVLALYYWHNSGVIYLEYRLNHACANKMKFP